MHDVDGIVVREAIESDVPEIHAMVVETYGEDYPFRGYLDLHWLKRSVFVDDVLMLVALDTIADDRLVGTASVIFDVGVHSDLVGELGRLVVCPDARGRGIGKMLVARRTEIVENRLHLALVENRVAHEYSQRTSLASGYAPVGLLPLRHRFIGRESISLWVRHFGACLALRRNHPRVVPDVYALARLALINCGVPDDLVVDEDSPAYPLAGEDSFVAEDLEGETPTLIRIERGRVSSREVVGPVQLHHGFFKIRSRNANYIVARRAGDPESAAGALGYITDEYDRSLRVFELISRNDDVVRFLLTQVLERCAALDIAYVEVDVSAFAPRMQRTLVELGFFPVAYVPALMFQQVERLDVVRMAKLRCAPELGEMKLTEESQAVADEVLRCLRRRAVAPRLQAALPRIDLFAGLDPEQATRIAAVCRIRDLRGGQRLFAESEPSTGMYVVLEGCIDVSVEGGYVGCVCAGEALGEVSLLTDKVHAARAVARTTTVVAVISRSALRELARRRSDIGVTLYRNLAVGLGCKLRALDRRLITGEHAVVPPPARAHSAPAAAWIDRGR